MTRGQYNSYTDLDFDIVSHFYRLDEYKESEGREGLSILKTAQQLKISRQTLSRWYNQWVKSGRPEDFEGFHEHRGRQTSLTPQEEKKLDAILEEKYISKNEILVDETISVEALALLNSTHGSDRVLRSRPVYHPILKRFQKNMA